MITQKNDTRREQAGRKTLPAMKSLRKCLFLCDFFTTIVLIFAITQNFQCFASSFSPSVTGSSMGETFYSQDIASAFCNPASLFLLDRSQVTASHWFLFDGARHNFFGYAERFEKFTAAFSGSQVYREQIEIRKSLTDEPSYTYSSQMVGLMSFASRAPFDTFYGANLKIAYYDIYDHKSTGYGLDVGAYREMLNFGSKLRNEIDISLSVGLLNLFGPTIKLVSDKETFPVILRTGMCIGVTLFPKYDVKKELLTYDKLNFVFEAITSKNTSLHYGIQYRLLNMLYLRIGYTQNGISAGLGITAGDIIFNYAVIPREYTVLHAADVAYKFGETRAIEKTPDELEDFLKTQKKAERIFQKYYRDVTELVANKKYDSARKTLLKIIPLKLEDKDASALLDLCNNSIVAEKLSVLNKQYQIAISQNNSTEAYKSILQTVDIAPEEVVTKQLLQDFQIHLASQAPTQLEEIRLISGNFIRRINEKISQLLSEKKDFETAETELKKLQLVEPESENTFLQKKFIESGKAQYINSLITKAINFAKQNSLSEAYLCLKEAYRVSRDEGIKFQLDEIKKQYSDKHKFELTEDLYQKKLYYLAAISFANDEHQSAREAFFELKNRNVTFDFDVLEEAVIKQNVIQRSLP